MDLDTFEKMKTTTLGLKREPSGCRTSHIICLNNIYRVFFFENGKQEGKMAEGQIIYGLLPPTQQCATIFHEIEDL